MAVEIGTATDYLDLAAKLKIFLTTHADLTAVNQEWVCNRDDGTDMLFQGPGLSGAEEIFIGLKPYDNVGSDIYSWDVRAFTGYVAGNSFDSQPGAVSTRDAWLPLWNSSIPYWFIANGQRVIVIAKVGTTYQSTYLGKFNAYATPGQYPYPVFWGAMTNNVAYKYSDAALYFFPVCYYRSTYIFSPDGSIITGGGQTVAPNDTDFNLWPFNTVYNTTTTIFAKVAPFDSGDVTLIQSIIRFGSVTENKALFGELDGIFWIHGTGQSSESIVTIDGDDYMVFQDGAKTARNNFAAVRLV